MSAPTHKICSKCGGEPEPLSQFSAEKRVRDGRASECKTCKKARNAKYRADCAEKERARVAKYRAENREAARASVAKYRAENPDRARANSRRNSRKASSELTPAFVAARLLIPVAQLTPELLELKREQLKMHRLTKQLTKEIENGSK